MEFNSWTISDHCLGGIDGYSRLVTFLKCSSNNKKETVIQEFDKAINLYGVTSRVRTDKGGENVLIWSKMSYVEKVEVAS